MRLILATLGLFLLAGCSSSPHQEVFPNINICLFSSCSIQSRDAASGESLNTEGDTEQESTNRSESSLSGI